LIVVVVVDVIAYIRRIDINISVSTDTREELVNLKFKAITVFFSNV